MTPLFGYNLLGGIKMNDLYLKATEFRFEVISDLCSSSSKVYTKNKDAMKALQLSKSQVLRLKKKFDEDV